MASASAVALAIAPFHAVALSEAYVYPTIENLYSPGAKLRCDAGSSGHV